MTHRSLLSLLSSSSLWPLFSFRTRASFFRPIRISRWLARKRRVSVPMGATLVGVVHTVSLPVAAIDYRIILASLRSHFSHPRELLLLPNPKRHLGRLSAPKRLKPAQMAASSVKLVRSASLLPVRMIPIRLSPANSKRLRDSVRHPPQSYSFLQKDWCSPYRVLLFFRPMFSLKRGGWQG